MSGYYVNDPRGSFYPKKWVDTTPKKSTQVAGVAGLKELGYPSYYTNVTPKPGGGGTSPSSTYQPPAAAYQAPAPVYQAPAGDGGGGYGGGYAAPELAFPEVDLAGIWETAGQYADNEINPQLTEIDNQLQQAGYSADESQRAINEAYPVARRSLQKSIYENMAAGEGGLAAMGTGRGGGRTEILARAGEREATGLEGIETAKTRESGAINRALTQYQGQLGTQKTSLIGQRGGLQAAYSEQLRGNRFNEASTKATYGLNAAQLTENARQFNESLAASTAGAGTEAATGSMGYTGSTGSTTGSGANFFLTDADLAALGLGPKTTTAVKKTATYVDYAGQSRPYQTSYNTGVTTKSGGW